MPVGRYFRGLTTFDLLGNLIPGLVVLLTFVGFLPSPPLPAGAGGYALFAVVAFSLGMFIQYHASFATGERRSFRLTMQGAERLQELTKSDSDSDSDDGESDISSRIGSLFWGVTHAYFDPLVSPCRSEHGTMLDDVVLTNKIWDHLTETYDIPPNTKKMDVLYQLMSSIIDDVGSPSRAIRFQALRNFNRGMWVATWYLLVALVCAWAADCWFTEGETIYTGVVYARPAYFQYWTPVWHLVLVAVVLVWAFWVLTESFEEDYIEYLFSDYAVAITKNGTDVTLPNDVKLTVAHEWTGGDETSVGDEETD